MLKGYVQATPDNIKVGKKCYILNKPKYRDVHFIKPNTFGVVVENLNNYTSNSNISSVEVCGRWVCEYECDDFEPILQIINLENLLVKEVK